MAPKNNRDDSFENTSSERHDPLYWQYRTVGHELIAFEARGSILWVTGDSNENHLEFRRGVSFVPLEVLSSYLDDLLDLDVSDEKLFIKQHSRSSLFSFSLALTVCLVGIWCYLLSSNLLPHYQGLTLVLSPAFALLILGVSMIAPYRSLRRLRFARVVSREISRRKGDGSGAGVVLFPLRGQVLQSNMVRREAQTATVLSARVLSFPAAQK